jgi:RNA polymerase sigma-70 factor (ECF subfamily)
VLTWRADGTPAALIAFTVTGTRITAIDALSDPARLAATRLPPPE